MRVRVAYYIAQALDYCNIENQKIYHDLSASGILYDEDGDPRLSTFGLIKNSRYGTRYSTNLTYTPPEFSETGKDITSLRTLRKKKLFHEMNLTDIFPILKV